MPIRPGKTESGNEMCASLVWSPGTALNQQRLNTIHRSAKILVGPGPAGGMDTGFAAKCVDNQPRIIGECWLAARASCRRCFDARVLRKGRSRLFRFGEAKLAGRLCGNAV